MQMQELQFQKMAVKKAQKDRISIEIHCLYYLEAPVEKNEIIGNVKIQLEEENIGVYPIVLQEQIKKKEIQDYLLEFLSLAP